MFRRWRGGGGGGRSGGGEQIKWYEYLWNYKILGYYNYNRVKIEKQ